MTKIQSNESQLSKEDIVKQLAILELLKIYKLECEVNDAAYHCYQWEVENDFPYPQEGQRYKICFDWDRGPFTDFEGMAKFHQAVIEICRWVLECLQNDHTHVYVNNKQFKDFFPEEYNNIYNHLLPDGNGIEIECSAVKMEADRALNKIGWKIVMVPHEIETKDKQCKI